MNENEVTRVNYRNKLNFSRLFNMLNWYEFNVFQDMSSSDMYCGCIPADTHESFVEMLSFSLLKDPVFVLFVVSNFATSLGFYVPYFCLADRMKVLGMPSEEASYLLSSIGGKLESRIHYGIQEPSRKLFPTYSLQIELIWWENDSETGHKFQCLVLYFFLFS